MQKLLEARHLDRDGVSARKDEVEQVLPRMTRRLLRLDGGVIVAQRDGCARDNGIRSIGYKTL